MSCCVVLAGVPVSGKLALVIVQVLPTVVSVQAEMALVRAELEPIFAPAIGRVPPGSAAISIWASPKALRATLVSVESYSLPWSASRRKIAARCAAPAAVQERLNAVRSPVVIVPPEACGAAKG